MAVTNRMIPGLIERRAEFKANNVFAVDVGGGYAVYSYGLHFPMAALINGVWYVNSDKYSVTTSRHQSLVKQGIGYGVPVELMNTHELSRKIGSVAG